MHKTFVILLNIVFLLSCNSVSKKDQKKLIDKKAEQVVSKLKLGFSNEVFDKSKPFSITQLTKTNDYPSSKTDTSMCENWSLTSKEVYFIVENSQEISSHEWHYLFDHLPCKISGKIIQQQNEFNLSINGGAWFSITSPDTTIYYGCFEKNTNKYFLSTIWKEGLE